jgi:hypothetical protein
MNEWLDVMLEEIARKKREAEEARAEQARREQQQSRPARNQSK